MKAKTSNHNPHRVTLLYPLRSQVTKKRKTVSKRKDGVLFLAFTIRCQKNGGLYPPSDHFVTDGGKKGKRRRTIKLWCLAEFHTFIRTYHRSGQNKSKPFPRIREPHNAKYTVGRQKTLLRVSVQEFFSLHSSKQDALVW